MSQVQLAEKANVSRSHISAIEAPGIVRAFSLEVFFNIADALQIAPEDLICASVFSDQIINEKQSQKHLTMGCFFFFIHFPIARCQGLWYGVEKNENKEE